MRELSRASALGRDPGAPELARQGAIAEEHVEAMLIHYGSALGLKNARKHVGWYLESSGQPVETVKAWRRRLCTEDDPRQVRARLREFYGELREVA